MTLAIARVILGAKTKDSSAHAQSITFDTMSKGNLSAKLDLTTGQISLDFPSTPPGDICDESFPNLKGLLCACLGESNRDRVTLSQS